MSFLFRHRFLVLRRLSQIGILALFWLGAHHHVGLLTGDLSSSRVLRTVPLSDPYAVLQILATGHALEGTVLLGALIVVLFYLVVGGRSFCGWVCPINPVADGAGWLRRRLGVRGQLRVPRHARYWVAGLGVVLSALLGVAAFEWVSPIGMVQRELIFSAGFGLLAIVWIAVLDVFVLRHGWCGSLCPVGAFYGLLGRFAWLRVGFDASRCDHCGDCVRVCSEPQVLGFDEMAVAGFVDDGACLNCGRCLEVCPQQAFDWTSRFGRGPDRPVEPAAAATTSRPTSRPTIHPRRENVVRANAKHAVWTLLIVAPLVLAGAAFGEGATKDAEVDDGIDVYFRDVNLGALSPQAQERYGEAEPGESKKLERAWPDAPPGIPHTVEDMLPITTESNECLECHHPENVVSKDDLPVTDTHFQNAVMVEGKSHEPLRLKVKEYVKGEDLSGARFNCTMCHTPQATNVDTPKTTFSSAPTAKE